MSFVTSKSMNNFEGLPWWCNTVLNNYTYNKSAVFSQDTTLKGFHKSIPDLKLLVVVLSLNEADKGIVKVVDWIYADCGHNKKIQIIFVSHKFKNFIYKYTRANRKIQLNG